MRDRLPLVILAGSDPKPAELPESGSGLHPLAGYKGMDLRIRGRPLIDLLIDSLRACGCFEPIFIAGPRGVYGAEREGAAVIDTDLNFSRNIERAVATVSEQRGHGPLAFTTCDILPRVEELTELMSDYYHHAPMDFWFPLILAPDQPQKIGASFWKPNYRIAPRTGEPAKVLLPGHLLIADTGVVRLPLVYQVLGLTYRTRNRPVLKRLALIVSHVFAGLVLQDAKNLGILQPPVLTAGVIYNAVMMAVRLHRGVITADELGKRLHKIFVHRRHRQRHPQRQGRLPLLNGLSLARDIDTEEEAREIADKFE